MFVVSILLPLASWLLFSVQILLFCDRIAVAIDVCGVTFAARLMRFRSSLIDWEMRFLLL